MDSAVDGDNDAIVDRRRLLIGKLYLHTSKDLRHRRNLLPFSAAPLVFQWPLSSPLSAGRSCSCMKFGAVGWSIIKLLQEGGIFDAAAVQRSSILKDRKNLCFVNQIPIPLKRTGR